MDTHYKRSRARVTALAIACVAALLSAPAPAAAATITFTHGGTAASGSLTGPLSGLDFGSTDFVITATADTDDRQGFAQGYFVPHQTASIALAGIGTFDFVTPTLSFVNNQFRVVGFSRPPDLFNGPSSGIFSDYDLRSSVGPVSGGGRILQWDLEDVETSGGVLFLASSDTPATFEAVAAPIPLPAGGALLLAALAALSLLRRGLPSTGRSTPA